MGVCVAICIRKTPRPEKDLAPSRVGEKKCLCSFNQIEPFKRDIRLISTGPAKTLRDNYETQCVCRHYGFTDLVFFLLVILFELKMLYRRTMSICISGWALTDLCDWKLIF